MSSSPSLDRIPCLNPRCRRTASRERYEQATTIVCRKCWRTVPVRLRVRDRQLRERQRRLLRLLEKRARRGTINDARIDRLQHAFKTSFWSNWTAIRKYFQAPEQPIGLESFLKEVGL